MLIDTSAIVAILAPESDAPVYLAAIESASSRFVGAHVRLECTINLARILGLELLDAESMYDDFLAMAKIDVLSISDAVSRVAVDAYARFGKGQGHPAQLNFADCFSYACAVSIAAPILFKGNDFRVTDLRSALD
jgi:ribonuclease VapC